MFYTNAYCTSKPLKSHSETSQKRSKVNQPQKVINSTYPADENLSQPEKTSSFTMVFVWRSKYCCCANNHGSIETFPRNHDKGKTNPCTKRGFYVGTRSSPFKKMVSFCMYAYLRNIYIYVIHYDAVYIDTLNSPTPAQSPNSTNPQSYIMPLSKVAT